MTRELCEQHKLIMPYSDRSIGLEKRDDLTGRLIRLMSSTYLASSAEAAGKLLFSVCGSDRKFRQYAHSIDRS